MLVLLLNDMRSSHVEDLQPVARAETREALISFMQREEVEPYTTVDNHVIHHTTDSQAGTSDYIHGYKFRKTFRHGGPLEWYNKPYDAMLGEHIVDVGTQEDWAAKARREYDMKILPIMQV
jgi:glucose dehydrogenase